MQTKNNHMVTVSGSLKDIYPVTLSDCILHHDDSADALSYCMKDIISTHQYAAKMSNYIPVLNIPGVIDRVIFNDPATIVIWIDGTKTVVKRSEDDVWDPEKGLCMAIIKKLYGHTSFIKKYIDEPEEISIMTVEEACDSLKNFGKKLNDLMGKGGEK